MISAIISIIFTIIILGVIFWALQQLLPLIPLGEPFRTILRVLLIVLGVIIVLWICIQLLDTAGFGVVMPFGRYH